MSWSRGWRGGEAGSSGTLREAQEAVNACLNIVSSSCPYFPFMIENANVFNYLSRANSIWAFKTNELENVKDGYWWWIQHGIRFINRINTSFSVTRMLHFDASLFYVFSVTIETSLWSHISILISSRLFEVKKKSKKKSLTLKKEERFNGKILQNYKGGSNWASILSIVMFTYHPMYLVSGSNWALNVSMCETRIAVFFPFSKSLATWNFQKLV